MDGVINVLKPPGMTSSDVVVYLRRQLKPKKIGHTGTLDPEASGVLPICVGKATKLSDYLMHQTKTYLCEMVLGIETDTSDMTGNIVFQSSQIPPKNQLMNVIQLFHGELDQIPPMHSAIKVNGQKLYNLARQGVVIDLPPRKIHIYSIKILHHPTPNTLLFEVTCSKGTYIRALCRDIGRTLKSGAAMSFLLRSRTGTFSIEDAYTLDEIMEAHENNKIHSVITTMEDALSTVMPTLRLQPNTLSKIKHGNRVMLDNTFEPLQHIKPNENCCIYCGELFAGIGYYTVENNETYIRMKNVFL